MRFKALVAVVVGMSLMWIGNYIFVMLPAIREYRDMSCRYNDSQLTYNAQMLFVYFAWFVFARLALFVPCIAFWALRIQSRSHGFCRAYCVHLLLRDGPLYIFVLGSLLFWLHLMQSPICEERSPQFYRALKLYAIYSNLVSMLSLILAYWHNKLLAEAAEEMERRMGNQRGAPPDTLQKLETRQYDEELFGDEDGKPYASECAICLGSWEADDIIKVTPCGHAFHEECIGSWLAAARTCALCRQDLTLSAARQSSSATSIVPFAQTVGAPSSMMSPDVGGSVGPRRPAGAATTHAAPLEDV